jgi:hypothetical protein
MCLTYRDFRSRFIAFLLLLKSCARREETPVKFFNPEHTINMFSHQAVEILSSKRFDSSRSIGCLNLESKLVPVLELFTGSQCGELSPRAAL